MYISAGTVDNRNILNGNSFNCSNKLITTISQQNQLHPMNGSFRGVKVYCSSHLIVFETFEPFLVRVKGPHNTLNTYQYESSVPTLR